MGGSVDNRQNLKPRPFNSIRDSDQVIANYVESIPEEVTNNDDEPFFGDNDQVAAFGRKRSSPRGSINHAEDLLS